MSRCARLAAVFLSLAPLMLAGCGLVPGSRDPLDTAEEFYAHQLPGSEPLPESVCASDEIARKVEQQLLYRTTSFGAYRDHKRIGSNKMVSFGNSGRKEKITYIYEVDSEKGRTRETLMLSRSRKNEPYQVVAYIIEEVPVNEDPAPMGTSSA